MPLVNELVIGLPDKDRFNASAPQDDAQFADYVTNPSLPVLLQALFGSAGVLAPNVYPRTDLDAAFLTGLKGLNQPAKVTAGRGAAAEHQHRRHAARLRRMTWACSVVTLSGFPNGRRPIDDVVDIELRVAMGVLLSPFDGSAMDPDPASDASRQLHYTDGAEPNPANYLPAFPYLNTALAARPPAPTTRGADIMKRKLAIMTSVGPGGRLWSAAAAAATTAQERQPRGRRSASSDRVA